MKIGIVGSGIAGLGLAYYLRNFCKVTVFEREARLGGHSNTIVVDEGLRAIPIDTGFMVFNRVTYPLLTELFETLHVPVKKTDMSFSVSNRNARIEFAGASFDRLFGDRRNIANLRFWKMLLQLNRFNKEAQLSLEDPCTATKTLEEYVRDRGYGEDFLQWYLLPMCSSVWSTPAEKMLRFPATSLLRFFYNHGFLGQDTQHQWWTVDGGSREYVRRLQHATKAAIYSGVKVVQVRTHRGGAQVRTADGVRHHFDHVVLACHADEALRLLHEPSQIQLRILSAFQYQSNDVVVHTDSSVMPNSKRCWASWNYRVDGNSASVHYWMNSLQGVSNKENYFVSLNARDLVKEESILRSMVYHHPIFDLDAVREQLELQKLNCSGSPIHFCGSYFRYGFHEDALHSAWQLAERLKEAFHASPVLPL